LSSVSNRAGVAYSRRGRRARSKSLRETCAAPRRPWLGVMPAPFDIAPMLWRSTTVRSWATRQAWLVPRHVERRYCRRPSRLTIRVSVAEAPLHRNPRLSNALTREGLMEESVLERGPTCRSALEERDPDPRTDAQDLRGALGQGHESPRIARRSACLSRLFRPGATARRRVRDRPVTRSTKPRPPFTKASRDASFAGRFGSGPPRRSAFRIRSVRAAIDDSDLDVTGIALARLTPASETGGQVVNAVR
jgi:hypothetical protein